MFMACDCRIPMIAPYDQIVRFEVRACPRMLPVADGSSRPVIDDPGRHYDAERIQSTLESAITAT
jgi:hypothetical protein